MTDAKILGIVGSLRQGSFNRSLMKAVVALAPRGVTMEIAEIGAIPIFNQDLESAPPEAVITFKEDIADAQGIIIATPEYNRSIPGFLKNAIDWSSRPYGTSPWGGKPVATMGASGGAIGAALAQYHLKQSLLYLGARVLGQPEFYLGGAAQKFDAGGVLTDENTREHLLKFWGAFLTFL